MTYEKLLTFTFVKTKKTKTNVASTINTKSHISIEIDSPLFTRSVSNLGVKIRYITYR